ncbi:MAG: class II fructose-bisphosphatase [Bdellovibrionota bacterium]
MDRNLALEVVRVTEAAALSASRWMGRGDETSADQAAVTAMREAFSSVAMRGTVVIGEGERDEAPMLYIGEKVGRSANSDPEIDIALDPLEGTTITAHGGSNALAVIAFAERGGFLHAPDTYMNKIAVGPGGRGAVDLDASPQDNIRKLAKALGKDQRDVTAIILDRPRHKDLIEKVRSTGARIRLIRDGDVSAAIATCFPETGIDILFGIGGAPEGVLAAAALRCVEGEIQGRLEFRNDEEKARAKKMGISDLAKKYTTEELAKGNVMFAATGVTDGDFLKGVRYTATGAVTHSVVMRSATRTLRFIEGRHHFEHKAPPKG